MARKTIRIAGSVLLAGALLGVPATATAGERVYPLSHLNLSVSGATGERASTTLSCSGGDRFHPESHEACRDLDDVDGHIAAIPTKDVACTMESNPTTLRAKGFWRGEERFFEEEFSNPCVALAETGGHIFDFAK